MIVLGKFVRKACPCGCQKTWPIYLKPGYLACVPVVPDYWRKDLDLDYNPRHVPSVLGPVTYGRISILVWGADERGWRPEYEHWNEEKSRPLTHGK